MNRLSVSIAVLVTLFLTAGTATCQTPEADPAAIQAAVEEAKARLNLTSEQEAQLQPLMEERAAKMKAIYEKHAGDTSRRAMRDMYREAKPVSEDYQAKVRAILTDEQEVAWEKMRAEARAKLKKRYREGQGPD